MRAVNYLREDVQVTRWFLLATAAILISSALSLLNIL